MSNYKKMIKAVKQLLEVMVYQEDEVNLIILKSIIEDYAHKCNIAPLQISKDLFDEFLDHKIERNYEKKIPLKEEKVEKEEKLYKNNQEAFQDYFKDFVTDGHILIRQNQDKEDNTEYLFYKDLSKRIFRPFMKSHKKEFHHKYQLG